MSWLKLASGETIEGEAFGAKANGVGEVVFCTGMVGYPQSLTDPSFAGQILVMTYPLIGNYGVPDQDTWESDRIWAAGLVVSSYIDTPSHPSSQKTLDLWLKEFKVPGIMIPDTRELTIKIRDHGAVAGAILQQNEPAPKAREINWVEKVSTKEVLYWQPEIVTNQTKTLVLIDCGVKRNIIRELLNRGVRVIQVPWDYDLSQANFRYDGVVGSNGPGDPKRLGQTVKTVKYVINQKIPYLGICLGNQILALAGGGDTYKLLFGHRSQNQPCLLKESQKCFLTTQNHGYAIAKIPKGFSSWFINANDGTNEGIRHDKLPLMSVQFHPESCPGPTDTSWIFDEFLERVG